MKEVDIEAEKKLLARLAQDWYAAENRKDIDAVMEFLTDDCICQPANVPQLVGKEAIRKFFEEGFFKILVSISGGPTRIEVSASGDLAYDIGTGRAVIRGPQGNVVDEEKYLLIWKKIDGEWKCVAGSFSSDTERAR